MTMKQTSAVRTPMWHCQVYCLRTTHEMADRKGFHSPPSRCAAVLVRTAYERGHGLSVLRRHTECLHDGDCWRGCHTDAPTAGSDAITAVEASAALEVAATLEATATREPADAASKLLPLLPQKPLLNHQYARIESGSPPHVLHIHRLQDSHELRLWQMSCPLAMY